MMTPTGTKRYFGKKNESATQFAERVVSLMHAGDGVDFGGGVMCRNCAPSTGYADDGRAEILKGAGDRCYNCHG